MFTWAYPNQSSYQLYKLSKYDDALTPSRKVESFTAMTKCQSGVSCNESEKVNFYQYFPKVKDSAWYKIAAVDAGGKIIAVTPAMKAAFPVPVVVDPVIDSFTLNTGVVTQDGGKVTVGYQKYC
jgi:arginine utilization protein RocB